jgi:hypothetical protein
MGVKVGTPRRIRCNAPQAFAPSLLLVFAVSNAALAAQPSGTEPGASDATSINAPKSLPQQNFFSSIKQSLRLGYDHEVVRGHFDQGDPPNSHRYYCLVDTKTHRREPNGVLGEPVPLPDGTTALKIDSVALFGCDDAEKQGLLVTAGYLLKGPDGVAVSQPQTQLQAQAQPPGTPALAPVPVPTPAPVSTPGPMPSPAQSPPPSAQMPPPPLPSSSAPVDVAGIKLGMPLDEVRALLKAKKLREYNESIESLGYLDSATGAMLSVAGGRFVNVVAAWTAPATGDSLAVDGESYSVMFTPIPGQERVMAIVHSVGYAPANAVREISLESGLVKKYGGYSESTLPQSPTWRVQSSGNVQIGDPCNRRGLFGGLGGLAAANPAGENLALKKTPEEIRFQIDHCGVAIVTEDHFTANGGALPDDRLVTRFTVTAYSPAIALEGAVSAARAIQAAKSALNKTDAARAKGQPAPNL